MTPRSKAWFQDAIKRGVDTAVAYIGTELIDGWKHHWGYDISDQNLEEMTKFALSHPEAAIHRWSIVAAPRPWLPAEAILSELRDNPTFSVLDILKRQGINFSNKPVE